MSEPLGLKGRILQKFEFLKNYKDLCGKCCWRARSATQQHFPYKSFKFPRNSNCHLIKTLSLQCQDPQTWSFCYFWLCSFDFWPLFRITTVFFIMIFDKVTRHSHAKGLLSCIWGRFSSVKTYEIKASHSKKFSSVSGPKNKQNLVYNYICHDTFVLFC